MKRTIAALLLLASTLGFAEAEVWGVAELKEAQAAALSTFQTAFGGDVFAAIEGFSIEKNLQGTAGKAKITYKKNGAKVTKEYFCHVHESEIDCH